MDSLFETLARTADGVLVIDDEQRIVFWNRAAQQILGYTAEEVLGRSCYEILGGCDEKGHAICCPHCYVTLAALSGDRVTSYDVACRTKTGRRRWINVSILVTPANEHRPTSLVVHLFRDANLAKQNEQFIRQMVSAVEQLQHSPAGREVLPPSDRLADELTPREREVLALLAQGLSTGDIARSLSISASTARNHIQNILNKLHVHSRLEAVTYAFEHGLVPKA